TKEAKKNSQLITMTALRRNSFLFQADGGIRDFHVTGVQTCALPIFLRRLARLREHESYAVDAGPLIQRAPGKLRPQVGTDQRREIGRASCRERVGIPVGAVAAK